MFVYLCVCIPLRNGRHSFLLTKKKKKAAFFFSTTQILTCVYYRHVLPATTIWDLSFSPCARIVPCIWSRPQASQSRLFPPFAGFSWPPGPSDLTTTRLEKTSLSLVCCLQALLFFRRSFFPLFSTSPLLSPPSIWSVPSAFPSVCVWIHERTFPRPGLRPPLELLS